MATKSLTTLLCSEIARKGFVNSVNVNFYSVAAAAKEFEFIKVQKTGKLNNVGLITLSRPKVGNAINSVITREIAEAVQNFDDDKEVGAIIITGEGKVFSGGADVKKMQNHNYSTWGASLKTVMGPWDRISQAVKPIIAPVNGLALGGGSELMMLCDIIYAAESAKIGQPEVLVGTFPGGGGTQRLTRAVGKYKAMEMILSGEPVSAQDAEKMGLVSKVFPNYQLMEETIKLAEKISRNSHLINGLCKEAVNTALETSLSEGLHFERRLFHGTFATKDRKEGMTAFLEKRPPKFTNE